MKKQNIVLLILAALLAALPLVIQTGAEFGGTDDQAKELISEVSPGYQPWVDVLWEPPSGEVESFLFAVQAAAGAGFIGYFFGRYQGRRQDKQVQQAG